MKVLAILSIVMILLVAGCAQQKQVVQPPPVKVQPPVAAPPQAQPPAAQPKVPQFLIMSPPQGGVGYVGDVNVVLAVNNLQIVPPSPNDVPNQGHFHLYLDQSPNYTICASTSCTVPNVTAGYHTITVLMHTSSHKPYPGVNPQTVSFALVAPGSAGLNASSFSIVSPTNGSIVSIPAATVKLMVNNFNFGTVGGPNNPNEGSFYLYLDNSNSSSVCSSTTCTVKGLGVGMHTIRVEMHNNDGTLVPGANSVQSVVVKAVARSP